MPNICLRIPSIMSDQVCAFARDGWPSKLGRNALQSWFEKLCANYERLKWFRDASNRPPRDVIASGGLKKAGEAEISQPYFVDLHDRPRRRSKSGVTAR